MIEEIINRLNSIANVDLVITDQRPVHENDIAGLTLVLVIEQIDSNPRTVDQATQDYRDCITTLYFAITAYQSHDGSEKLQQTETLRNYIRDNFSCAKIGDSHMIRPAQTELISDMGSSLIGATIHYIVDYYEVFK